MKISHYHHGLKYPPINRGDASFNPLHESTNQGPSFRGSVENWHKNSNKRILPTMYFPPAPRENQCIFVLFHNTLYLFKEVVVLWASQKYVPSNRNISISFLPLQLLGNHLSSRPSSRPLSPERSKDSKVCGLIE